MFILGNFIMAIAVTFRLIINLWELVIVVSAFMSFIPMQYNPTMYKIRSFIDACSNILLNPIKKFLPTTIGMFDFSPIIALFVLMFIDNFAINTLFDFARIMR